MQRALTLPARLRRDRRGGIALLFGLMLLPMIGLVGLAIDYGMYSQAYATLRLAANSAVLEAVKIAANGEVANDLNYQSEGVAAGQNWFTAQVGKTALALSSVASSVTITPGATITASLTGTAQAPAIFGKLFGMSSYSISIATKAVVNTAPYLEVVMLLDTSSSMSIGATISDMTILLDNSPCDLSNEFVSTDGATYTQASNVEYGNYQCTYYGPVYDGSPSCPLTSGSVTYIPAASGHQSRGPACPTTVYGHTAYEGPPCAFACHSDGLKPAGLGNDLWAMARRKGVTLRADVVKNAANDIIATMKTDSQAIGNLSLGIYTFDTAVTQVYPSTGEAGSDWTTAAGDVGSPPVAGSGVYTDTGIQPVVAAVSGNNNNTNFQEAMASLATSYVTSAGTGLTAASPKKVLFLITDGIEDDSNSGNRDAMPYTSCQQFKNMGYTVYVAYTPYYPIMDTYYLYYLMGLNEGSGTSSVAYNLQACSSSTGAADLSTYYITASDQSTLNAALESFLRTALNSPARYTQ